MTAETVPFGKYKGRPVEDMLADADYMAWLEAQPWFRERFASLLSRRDADAESRTPVHNRLQALFLSESYQKAFVSVVGGKFYPETRVQFEYSGYRVHADVFLQAGVMSRDDSGNYFDPKWWAMIEIKPTVADEYPAVLRQMKRNQSRFLFVERYEGAGVTEAQFVQIFAASDQRVVFKRDVDAELGRIRESAE